MLEHLEKQTRLTGNQYKIIAAAALGDALEFFDYYLIGYVLAFIIKPWQLTYGQSGLILLSSGVGADRTGAAPNEGLGQIVIFGTRRLAVLSANLLAQIGWRGGDRGERVHRDV